MTKTYTGDNITLGAEASLAGRSLDITSATIDVWNPAGTKVVTAAAVTINKNEATYLVLATVTTTAGTYKYEITVTLSGGHGLRSIQGTFDILARYP